MKSSLIYYELIILLLAPLIKANLDDFMNFQLRQESLRCIGVPCPSDRPKCIVQSSVAKCVADSADINTNRLSRRPPGLSLGRPSLTEAPRFPQLPHDIGGSSNPFQPNVNQQKNTPDASRQSLVPNFCFEPAKSGLCRAYFQSYYFNPRSGLCESFIYGGCGGNNNRFRYERDCKATCAHPFKRAIEIEKSMSSASATESPNRPTSVCQIGVDPGPCKAFVARFYFNPISQQCEVFNYGGCQGNRNNFESLAACQQRCQNVQQQNVPSQSGGESTTYPTVTIPQLFKFNLLGSDSRTGGSFSGSSFFDKTGQVLQSLLGNDLTPDAGVRTGIVVRSPMCELPKNVGPCRASIRRYFFNNDTQKCEQFTYGGCRGNENNFLSEQECFKACGSSNSNIINRPLQISQMQPFPFWNDPTNDAAFREFLISRHMKANGNMMGASTNNYYVCTQPINQGSCFEKIQSFFYNSQAGRCEPFVFRGCGGNRNRFKTMEACQQFCLNI